MQQNQNRRLIFISMLSAVAFVLTFIKFPLPFLPPYLTLDFSDVPTLLATFLLGPIAGIIVAFIKNLLNFFFNMGDPVGPVANFLAIASFLLAAYYIYKNKLSKQSLLIGLVIGTVVMTIVLSILKYCVDLPLYVRIFNVGDIVHNLKVIIVSGVIPFNIIKGIVISIIFYFIFNRIKNNIHL